MKKLVLLLVALICVQVTAFAVPDSVTTGPFKISFDLGVPKTNYMVTVTDPVTTESLGGSISTEYQFKIQNKIGITSMATFILTYDPNNAVLPAENEEKLIIDTAIHRIEGASNIQTDTRKIDGTYGGIASYDFATLAGNIKLYGLCYYPVSENGHLLVAMASGYLWEGETLQILRSLHIERISTDYAASGSKSYVGPTSAYAGSGLGAKSGLAEKNILSQP